MSLNGNGTALEQRILVVDDEPSIVDAVATALRYEGYEVDEAHNGPRRARRRRASRARPDRARLDAPRHRGHRGRPPPARAGLQDGGALPHREGRDREQGRGAARRRRRLRHEAVQPRRDRRAHPGDPAPHGGRAARRRAALRRPRPRRGAPRGLPRRDADRADGDRVLAAALLHAQPAPRAVEGPDPPERLALRLRRQLERRRDVRELPAQEARRRRAAADQDGAAGGLHARSRANA